MAGTAYTLFLSWVVLSSLAQGDQNCQGVDCLATVNSLAQYGKNATQAAQNCQGDDCPSTVNSLLQFAKKGIGNSSGLALMGKDETEETVSQRALLNRREESKSESAWCTVKLYKDDVASTLCNGGEAYTVNAGSNDVQYIQNLHHVNFGDSITSVIMESNGQQACTVRLFKKDNYDDCYWDVTLTKGCHRLRSKHFDNDAGDKASSAIVWSGNPQESMNPRGKKKCKKAKSKQPGCADKRCDYNDKCGIGGHACLTYYPTHECWSFSPAAFDRHCRETNNNWAHEEVLYRWR